MNPLPADTQSLVDHLHRGGAWNLFWNGDNHKTHWIPAGKPFVPPQKWLESSNLYFNVNPCSTWLTKPDKAMEWQSSTNATISALNCLYAEFDGKDFTNPTEQETKDAKFATNPTHYKALALAHVNSLNPAPSATVDSGGGYQCYWLLRDTFVIDGEDKRTQAKDWQTRWVSFVGGDPGARDSRRLLRFPGSRNHKKKYAPTFPLVSLIKNDLSLQYPLDQLIAVLPSPQPQSEPAESHHKAPTASPHIERKPYEGESVIDAYNASVSIRGVFNKRVTKLDFVQIKQQKRVYRSDV
jgi:hypothetical protein